MRRIWLLALSAMLATGCTAAQVRQDRGLDRTDYHYLRYDSIKQIGQQVVKERGLQSGDVVLLVPLMSQANDEPLYMYDDALISGLVRSGVRVVRLTENLHFYSGSEKVETKGSGTAGAGAMLSVAGLMGGASSVPPGPQNAAVTSAMAQQWSQTMAKVPSNIFTLEADLVRDLANLRQVGVRKILFYRWVFSNPRGSGYSDAKYQHTLRYPADRAYMRVVDVGSGQTIWANLLTAQR